MVEGSNAKKDKLERWWCKRRSYLKKKESNKASRKCGEVKVYKKERKKRQGKREIGIEKREKAAFFWGV